MNSPNKRTRGIHHHRQRELVIIKAVADCAAGNAQEGGADKAVEKTRDQHGLGVLCDSTRNKPDDKEEEGDEVYGTPPVELLFAWMRALAGANV